MSLNKLRASLRPKLNSSFANEQDNDPNSLVKEIKLLKENFDALKTPKLYQKIVCQYKANLKNRRLAEAMSGKSNSGKSEFYGSMDMLSVLRDSQKVNEFKYSLSQKYEDEEGQDSNKENFIDTSDHAHRLKFTVDFAVQTTPKHHINLEEFTKLRTEYDQQTKAVKVMEDDLSKIRIENIKLDKALKSAQENLAVLGKNQNNTSSSFSLPSEFKSNWELLAKDQIINVFSDFIDNPILVTNLVQEIIMICYDQVKTVIKEVNCNILKILNLGEKSEADIKKHLANFYQDNHSSIFKLDEARFEKIRNLYKKLSEKIFTHEYTNELANFPPEDETGAEEPKEADDTENNQEEKEVFKVEIREEYQEQFEEMLETDDFNKFVSSVFYLCLFMLLNDPPLRVPIENFKNRKFVYKRFKKNDFICVDGFAKENSPCLVLLPAVVRNNYPYNGIKPSVLILQDEFLTPKIMKVLQDCDREEQERLAKKQEKELMEEKLNQNDQTTTEIHVKTNISIDEKYIPPSLNTTNICGVQHNDLLSHSTNALNHSNIIMSKKIQLEDLENSKINEEAATTDVTTIQPSNNSKAQMILPRDEDESLHNQTISNLLTERRQHDANTSTNNIQLTPQQDSYSSSSRERTTKTKRYPLPLHNLDNSFRNQENNNHRVSQNKSLYIKPLSSRRDDYENKETSGNDNHQQKICEIYNVLQMPDTEEKHRRLNRSSFSSEVVLKNGNFNLHHHHHQFVEEKKADDYSMNEIVTQRTNRGGYQDKNSGSKALSEYKNILAGASARGNSSNSKMQNYYNREDRSERDISVHRETSQERDASYRVNELRDKIRKSFLTNRGTQGENMENSMMMSRLNDSSIIRQGSRIKERPELNNTITTIKQSIELLKQSKAQNDRNRSRIQDSSYDKLNTSMAGKIRNQSDRLSGSFLKQLDDSYVADSQPKRDGIVSRMVAEKMKTMEKKFQERQKSQDRRPVDENQESRPSQVLNHEYLKQKLNKLGLNTRSISTNRSHVNNKLEEENKNQANESFRRDSSFSKGLNRAGSINKFNHKTERLSAKETEESLQIFRALKNIYQKS